jgi:hypothetical protein
MAELLRVLVNNLFWRLEEWRSRQRVEGRQWGDWLK